MADLRQRIEAEFENIDEILSKLPSSKSLPNLTGLELAGVGALLHGFYNGIENVLRQVLQEQRISLPKGETWHRDLLNLAVSQAIISKETAFELRQYLAFRHFFSHAYALDLDSERITPLVRNARDILDRLKSDLAKLCE